MKYRAYILFFIAAIGFPIVAEAYVGPGPALGFLGSLMSLIGGVFLALFMVILYPIRRLLKYMRRGKDTESTDNNDSLH